jgi:DNA polymerase
MQKLEQLAVLNEKIQCCQKCPDFLSGRLNTVFGEGNPYADIVFCGEGPGQQENETGRPFVGKAGQLLDNILKACGFTREQVFILNIVKCRPPNNRVPTDEECSNCRPFLELQLKIINPKIIVCLGTTAANNILGVKAKISQLRGTWHSYKNPPVAADVLATYHPSYLLRNPKAKSDVAADMAILLAHPSVTLQSEPV